MPLAVATGGLDVTGNDSFLDRELKFAKRWLYSKGVMTDDEDANPVETEMLSFFNNCRNGGRPNANLDIGLNDSIAVMLSNLCMKEERRVNFSEMDSMGKDMSEQDYLNQIAKSEQSYIQSLAAKKKVDIA
jgi:hypothetical protein